MISPSAYVLRLLRRKPRTRREASLALLAAVAGAILFVRMGNAAALPQDFSLERMRGTLDAEGFAGLESGSVPRHLEFNVGLLGGYARNPLVITTQDGTRLGTLLGSRAGGSLTAAVGLFNRLELGFELPFVPYQARGEVNPRAISTPLPELASAGLGDLRLVAKFGLLQRRFGHPVELALIGAAQFPTAGSDHYLGEAGPSLSPELALGVPIRKLRILANFRVMFREPRKFGNQLIRTELLAGIGAAYRFDLKRPLELGAGLFAGASPIDPLALENQTPIEARAQASWAATPSLDLVLGGGVGVYRGWGTPDWRVFASVRYTRRLPPSLDSDGDGLFDEVDRCPGEPEDKDGHQDADGCPDPDNDGDGLPDAADKCPNVAEDRDGFEDTDGCPDPDNDGDGVPDAADQCPNVAGKRDEPTGPGCPPPPPPADTDGDGIADALDMCPNDAEDKDGFLDEDGCPDLDNDGDGVLDTADKCPDVAGSPLAAGCAEPDRDADTVIDRLDNCPDEPGTAENSGCKAKQLVALTNGKLEILDSVYFKLAKDVIEARSFPLLDNVATVILAHPEINAVRVEGHTDNQGKAASNLKLSDRRAASVVKYLVQKGVPAARLQSAGYGDTKPIADNATVEGRAKNRRVVFTIVGDAASAIEKSDNGPTADTIEKTPPPSANDGAKTKTKKGEQ